MDKMYYAGKAPMNFLRLVILIICSLAAAAAYFFLSFIPIIMWILVCLFVSAALYTVIFYLPIYFKNLCYYIRNNRIFKCSGVYYKKKKIMPIDSIQYTTSVSTAILKKTGFNFIILSALGGKMIVAFLNQDDLQLLMSEISS